MADHIRTELNIKQWMTLKLVFHNVTIDKKDDFQIVIARQILENYFFTQFKSDSLEFFVLLFLNLETKDANAAVFFSSFNKY